MQPETATQQKQPWDLIGGIQFNKQPFVVKDEPDGRGSFRVAITMANDSEPERVFGVFIKRNPDGDVRTVMICFDRLLDYPEPEITKPKT
jgi:hypothetical protein